MSLSARRSGLVWSQRMSSGAGGQLQGELEALEALEPEIVYNYGITWSADHSCNRGHTITSCYDG